MRKLALLVPLCCLPSCALVLQPLHHSKPDPSGATVKINQKSKDPFGGPVASIEYPGAPQTGQPAGAGGGGTAQSGNASPGGIFDFSSAFSQGMIGGQAVNWRRSATEAALEARQNARPMLIFLSDPRVPTSMLLEAMLGRSPQAAALITPHFVPLCIDFSDKRTNLSDYYRSIKNRYKPRGYPLLVAALPDGTEVTRQSGYAEKMDLEAEWQKRTLRWIEGASAQVKTATTARRKRLTGQGYREWHNAQGAPVFARLAKVDANQVVFVGEWGEPFKTFTSRLSEADQRLLQKQAAAHQEKSASQ